MKKKRGVQAQHCQRQKSAAGARSRNPIGILPRNPVQESYRNPIHAGDQSVSPLTVALWLCSKPECIAPAPRRNPNAHEALRPL